MSLTIDQVFELRTCAKLALPKSVQDNIAKLRITPVTFKPFRLPPKHHHHKNNRHLPENWREKALIEYVSRIKDQGDPEYFELFGIFNKLTSSNLEKLTSEAMTIMKKRDDQFRLRIVTLMFDKAISDNMFAAVMADCALKLTSELPDIKSDLNTQITMFPKLYNMSETLTFPSVGDLEFDNKVVLWMKQKTKRRGYSKFMTQLFIRGLVSEETMMESIKGVLEDLYETSRKPKLEQTEENTTHLVDFLFEVAKLLPSGSTPIRSVIRESGSTLLAIPRPDVPSLCMRSRFKLEDAVKCVQ